MRHGCALRRWLLLAATVLVAGGCSGILDDSGFGVSASPRTRDAPAIAKGPAKEHYLAVTAKRDGAVDQIFSGQVLFSPFSVQATAGLFDPKHADVGGGTYELDLFPFTVRCAPTAAGTTVSAILETNGSTFGTLDLPGAAIVDLAVTYDGLTATVTARKEGDAQFTTVGSLLAAGVRSVEPGLFAGGLKKRSVVGFAKLRVLQRGARPGTPTPQTQAVDALWAALDRLADAVYAADGVPDLPTARTNLAAAVAPLTTARDLLDGLPDSKTQRKASKQAAAALRFANAAIVAIDAGKPAAKVLRSSALAFYDADLAARAAKTL